MSATEAADVDALAERLLHRVRRAVARQLRDGLEEEAAAELAALAPTLPDFIVAARRLAKISGGADDLDWLLTLWWVCGRQLQHAARLPKHRGDLLLEDGLHELIFDGLRKVPMPQMPVELIRAAVAVQEAREIPVRISRATDVAASLVRSLTSDLGRVNIQAALLPSEVVFALVSRPLPRSRALRIPQKTAERFAVACASAWGTHMTSNQVRHASRQREPLAPSLVFRTLEPAGTD